MSYRYLPHNLPARDLATTNHARRCLSIKWKALLLATLVVVSIFDVFSTIRYLNLFDPFKRQRQVTRDHNRQEVGTCGIAVHTAKVVSTPDIENDPNWRDLKDLPPTLDLRAA